MCIRDSEEQQHVERHEHAQHGGLQQQEERVVFLEPVLDGAPTRQDGEKAYHRGEHDQQESEPVDAQVVGSADAGNPGGLFLEGPGARAIELEDQRQGYQESDKRCDIGPELDQARVRCRQEHQHQEAGQWREKDDRENVVHRADWRDYILSLIHI